MQIDEIFVIAESGLPIFYYNSDKTKEESDDFIMQSSFFTAIGAFAQEMSKDEIKHVIFEKKGYAIKNLSDYGLKVIFGEFSSEIDLTAAETQIATTSGFVNGFLSSSFPNGIETIIEEDVNKFNKALQDYLMDSKLIPDTSKFKTVEEQNKRVKSFIYNSLGYKPGQCNIGKVERQKRLLTGLGFGILSAIILIGLIFLENNFDIPRELRLLLLPLPIFMAFQGFYQYFFKFCVSNALKNRYQMY